MRFTSFRRPLLAKLFPGSTCVDKIEYEEIDTQHTLDGSGRPDIVVDHDAIYALVEIKVYTYRKPTENQPTGYFHDLLKDKRKERWLVFLVPKGWEFEKTVKWELELLKKEDRGVQTQFVYWEDVLDIINEYKLQDLNPFFGDFYRLVKPRYRPDPIKFETKELDMMYSKEIPEALLKLDKIIEQIQAKSSVYKPDRKHSGRKLYLEEDVLYFKNEKGELVFFFGEWTKIWEEEKSPLCFGVNTELKNEARVFGSLIKDAKNYNNWSVKAVSRDDLEGENAAEKIWERIKPVLEAVINAGSQVDTGEKTGSK